MKIFQVDAFTEKPFSGNPAGVCILEKSADESWMQNVAMEMNLSETAFLFREKDGFNLRWFTPKMEVNLCGHATLASAYILYTEGYLKAGQNAEFYTKSGILKAELENGWIQLDFPSLTENALEAPRDLARGLGAKPLYVGKCGFMYLAELESEKVVRDLKPDFSILGKPEIGSVIVTSRASTRGYDFVSRFFAPSVGINEDPVTGSAHCILGPYWSKKLDKTEFIAYQASARGGVLKVKVGKDRVYLGGQAVTVLKAELLY
ncbi:MAG TPA: PhzF family phenazine biosynthesis protein [Terriglobales bacterium]|nr:PhzF family phenazine biosynthesis protein [Terriglobales bacterium]